MNDIITHYLRLQEKHDGVGDDPTEKMRRYVTL